MSNDLVRLGRHLIVALLALIGVASAGNAQGRSPAELARLADSVQAAGGRVIVLLKSSDRQARLMAPGSDPLTTTELQQISTRLQSGGVTVTGQAHMIGGLFARVDAPHLAALNADSNVLAIEADRIVYLQDAGSLHHRRLSVAPAVRDVVATPTPAIAAQTTPWGINQITAPAAWSLGYRGTGVKVGIMDSGADATHPDLAIAGGYNAATGGTSPADWNDDIASCGGHGTHVAGTVAALDNGVGVVGVAPEASLYAIKVFENLSGGCGAWISTQITAVQWAAAHGIRVINASIGGPWSYAYQIAVDQAAAVGTFLVAAAGNDNGGPVDFPAAFPSAIAVGSLNSANARSSFSNVGPELEVGAPGENIESTVPGGGYANKSGTSMATPHVTGVVALLVQQNPSITLAQVRTALQNGALDVATPGFDNNTGWGLVRAANSLGAVTQPVALSVAPQFHHTSVVQGGTPAGDNATVTLTGTNAATTTWTATHKKSWTTLTIASGTGSGSVTWTRSATGLAVGTYVDTITVTAPGAASGSPALVFDTLTITAAVVPVNLAVSPASRNVTVTQGGTAPGDNATVTLTGTNAATTAWTATHKKSWLTLTTASGTGSGTVAWTRNATGLAVGTYVDTITVTAPGAATGSPAHVYDTLQITAAIVPVNLALSPTSKNLSVTQGASAPGDNAIVTLTGTNAATTSWTATHKKSWTTLTTASGTGSGTVAWTRNASGLAVGTYVDTITVTAPGAATGSPAMLYDTLRITAAIIPVNLALSPGSTNVTVTQGGTAPSDNATVTLTGTNAATTTWTATHKQTWVTLTGSSGTGSGFVTWNRNATGLGVGTYVDTITVTAPGAATGSPAKLYDTLQITAPIIPVNLALSPASKNVAVTQGGSAPGDNATVTLTGTGASTATWTASHKKSWTTLTTASGTGNGTVRWTRNATGLAVGTYVDTITVTAPGAATGSPAALYDTLRVTAPIIPVNLAVAPSSRNVSVVQGATAPGDNATVTLTGTNAGSTTWSATHKKSWNTLTVAGGSGSGTITWTRNATGLAAGTYVDTITVTAPGAATGSPAAVYDTMRITAPIVPVNLALAPTSRNVAVQQGNAAPSDNATVTLTGTNAATTTWTATHKKSWTTLTTASGTGSGTVAWTRNATGLAVGTWVDTITVTAPGAATGSPATLYDTLRITAAPVPVNLALAPSSRNVSVTQGASAPGDNATVTLTGTGASTTTWTATHRQSWTTLTTASGTGTESVTWTRNASGLGVGTYVDTITVTAPGAATGSPAALYDTLRITAAPIPVTLALAPSSKNVTVAEGATAPGDNASVTLSGTAAGTTTWSATHRQPWNTLVQAGGTGSGSVTWIRSASGLPAGTYVDTITVTALGAASGSPATLYDTMRVTAALVPVTLTLSPAARSVRVQQGSAAPGDAATVTLAGTLGSATTWSATHRQSWNTLTAASGTGSGSLAWTRNASGLAAGIHVDTITVSAPGAAQGSPAILVDTLRITAAPVALTLIVAPPSRSVEIAAGAAAPASSATVTLAGDNAASARWTSSSRKPWTVLTTASGTGSGTVAWSRNSAGFAAGVYVDTITVIASGGTLQATVVDSLRIDATSSSLAIKPGGRRTRRIALSGMPHILAPIVDSALVDGTADPLQSDTWTASVTSSRLELMRATGSVNAQVVWQRLPVDLPDGLHIDSVVIRLDRDPSISAVFVDTLDVSSVVAPDPKVAVEDLFQAGSLTDDQRMALDQEGNNNGHYDIGDFLAWVDRGHLSISAEVAARLKALPVARPSGADRPRPKPKP